ncbi:MAG: DUF3473 domain-containing protein [Desulfobacteraceae bacterium]|nr:MAG: DUF3473 domain-containing protein [Desulfobacteraceae bacterium]
MAPVILLTFDIEDWFQVENFKAYIPFSSWPAHELRVEKNTHRILDLLDSFSLTNPDQLLANSFTPNPTNSTNPSNPTNPTDPTTPRATFFVLGWIAERLPGLVREIQARGHEVASHGYLHDPFWGDPHSAFKDDIIKSKKLLEDIMGIGVYGYRAPTFSIDHRKLAVIESCGYLYDSSFNSFAGHARYGRLDLSQSIKRKIAVKISDAFYEMPISNIKLGKYILPWGGGGYFRMMPSALFRLGVAALLKKEGAYLFYLHPWEIDPAQPRLGQAAFSYKIRHYMGLESTYSKLTKLFGGRRDCRFIACRHYLEEIVSNGFAAVAGSSA